MDKEKKEPIKIVKVGSYEISDRPMLDQYANSVLLSEVIAKAHQAGREETLKEVINFIKDDNGFHCLECRQNTKERLEILGKEADK